MTTKSKNALAPAASAFVAALALIATLLFNLRNDDRAERQEARLDAQEQRLNQEHEQQFANKVYIGEAPQYFYREFGGRPAVGEITWVVLNASGTQIYEVWVEGENNTSTEIGAIQRCTMYSLEPGFVPTGVHFRDPSKGWYRTVAGELGPDDEPFPDDDTADSPYVMDIQDCTG